MASFTSLLCGTKHDSERIQSVRILTQLKAKKRFLAEVKNPFLRIRVNHDVYVLPRRRKLNNVLRAPLRVKVSVEPKQLQFNKVGEEKIFQMTLCPKSVNALGYIFAKLNSGLGKEQMKTRSSSSAALVPFVKSPAGQSREALLQIVDPTSSSRKLLPGWTIVKRPRSSSTSRKGSVDTYFIEPGTGREFPSLESVQRYLVGEVHDRRLTRTGQFFNERTRLYEESRTKQDRRRSEYASKGFRLPKGWIVEEFPRLNSYHIDKFYVERKTGYRFRSLVSVERYLKDPGKRADKKPMLIEYHRPRSKGFSLPDGWIVEGKPRSNSSHIDKTYIEPGTGNKFRSLAAVERYLNGTDDSVNSMVPSGRLLTVVVDENPPEKVKWVLNGPGGNMFSAHVSGSVVSSSVKQTWSEAFVSLIQDRF
ncbi:unnamed protein product [Brassica oleracea var. botrytis]